jgi:hypothetical protein
VPTRGPQREGFPVNKQTSPNCEIYLNNLDKQNPIDYLSTSTPICAFYKKKGTAENQDGFSPPPQAHMPSFQQNIPKD